VTDRPSHHGITPRMLEVVEEYAWLHEVCGVTEERVAHQLGMSRTSLLDKLRKAGHQRPARTINAALEAAEAERMSRARVGRW
jgi:DNA-binding transcriptional regulator LsrR (DeoR family)